MYITVALLFGLAAVVCVILEDYFSRVIHKTSVKFGRTKETIRRTRNFVVARTVVRGGQLACVLSIVLVYIFYVFSQV